MNVSPTRHKGRRRQTQELIATNGAFPGDPMDRDRPSRRNTLNGT